MIRILDVCMAIMRDLVVMAVGALMVACVCGCAGPTTRADRIAHQAHFDKQIERGGEFRHVVYRNDVINPTDILHVYIEGDGTPYSNPDTVATDPTPRNPLMLRLMTLDTEPSIYVGRPCYFALQHDTGCSPIFWTLRRYSPEVLDSMSIVIRAEALKAGANRIHLFGHSGGGSVAVLLANRLDGVIRVVTLGANLDTTAWSALHNYTPLTGSENPAGSGAKLDKIAVLHFVGAGDNNTPPFLVIAGAHARGAEAVRVVPNFDHSCCWSSMWPEILAETE